jgi:alpha-tubulin suppressor-like RCC1 family protein
MLAVIALGPTARGASGRVVALRPWAAVTVTNLPPGLTNIVAVSAGLDDALALREDGTVVAWGAGEYGITNVPPDLGKVVAIRSGWLFHMALREDGTVATWGGSQAAVPPGLSNVVAIAAGGHQFCLALRADRTVVAWGWNGSGQTNVPAGLTNVIGVAAGLDHSVALRGDGTVVAWGANTFGATLLPTNLTDVVAISAGWSQTFALRANGTVVGWGTDGTNLPPMLNNVGAVAAGWDAGQEILLRDGRLRGNSGVSNVLAVARGHFFALAIVNDRGPSAAAVPWSEASWADGRFRFSAATRYGGVYAPQYKDRLADDQWSPLDMIAGDDQVHQVEDRWATSPHRFYRILRW